MIFLLDPETTSKSFSTQHTWEFWWTDWSSPVIWNLCTILWLNNVLTALLELQLNTNESMLKTGETGPGEDRRKKNQEAQNTVEYDGIKLQCYIQSLEKNYPSRKKKKFKDAAFSLSGGLPPCFGALLFWANKQVSPRQNTASCSQILGQSFLPKDSALKGHHFTISTVISQTLL